MSYFYNEEKDEPKITKIAICILAFIMIVSMAIGPYYTVWNSMMSGKAELAEANYNRQIAVVEAEAKKMSAEQLAEAEVARAIGVAKANEIIAKSITEQYLRYLWITETAGNGVDKNVVYIPTEANIPILEANRFE